MSTSLPSTLEEAIRHAGEGWLIDSADPEQDVMPHIRETLGAVQQEARRRLAADAPTISEAALLEEYNRNPQHVKAFFQAIAGTRSPEMLLMVWRVLEGMEVGEVGVNYRRQQSFELRVVLESPHGDKPDAPYVSRNIHDFALLRHVGIFEIGGTPVLDGFYPLRLRGISR